MRRNIKIITILTSAILVSFLSLYSRYHADSQPKTLPVKVLEVHDGDTISVSLNGKREKIRLIGIDAPELDQKPWGDKAKRHLVELIKTSQSYVSLEYDIEKRDKHGRLLCYVWLSDGRMLNLQMLKDGYAILFTVPPNIRYINKLRNGQHEARIKKVNIWGKEGLKEKPVEYRREHPGF
ncbi:MAG: thermonuclease family protein [Thermodesulfovibrionales bacterium]